MKGILKGRGKNTELPDTAVPSSATGGQLHGHAGFPEATDSLAYDAVQRLIAVGHSKLTSSTQLSFNSHSCPGINYRLL